MLMLQTAFMKRNKLSFRTRTLKLICPICRYKAVHKIIASLEEGHGVLKCQNCGVKSIYPLPSKESIKACYDDYYLTRTIGKVGGKLVDLHSKIFRYLLFNAEETVRDSGRVRFLDFGFGNGAFLVKVATAGHTAIGFEVSKQNCQQLKDYCENEGINIDVINLCEEKRERLIEMGVDIITLFQVIEHLPDPYEQVRELSRFLNKGGLLYIECPNEDSIYIKLKSMLLRTFGDKRLYNTMKMTEHLYGFNKISITAMLTRLGYKTLEVSDYYYNDGIHQVEGCKWWPSFWSGVTKVNLKSIVPVFDKACSILFSRGSGLCVLAKKSLL